MFIDYFSENRAVYEIMWNNIVQPDRPQMTIWRMRLVCWITKATNGHSEYVILTAFLRHQSMNGHTSILCYTYIVCLVYTWNFMIRLQDYTFTG